MTWKLNLTFVACEPKADSCDTRFVICVCCFVHFTKLNRNWEINISPKELLLPSMAKQAKFKLWILNQKRHNKHILFLEKKLKTCV